VQRRIHCSARTATHAQVRACVRSFVLPLESARVARRCETSSIAKGACDVAEFLCSRLDSAVTRTPRKTGIVRSAVAVSGACE
jgi:hypothetical protein